MRSLILQARGLLMVAAMAAWGMFNPDVSCAEEIVEVAKAGNNKWKVQVSLKGRKLASVMFAVSSGSGEHFVGQMSPIGNAAGEDPAKYTLDIPSDLQQEPLQELTAVFQLNPAAGKPAAVAKQIRFTNGVFTTKAVGGRVVDPSPKKAAEEVVSGAPETLKKSAEQLKKWILDRAINWKVPGIAYFDHQPKKTTEAVAKLFTELAKKSLESKEITDSTQKELKIQELRNMMRVGLDQIYDSRPGVKDDWQPFLKEIQNEVGDSHSDDAGNVTNAERKFDLNNFEHISLVFGAIAGAFSELNVTHENVEKFFTGGGSLSGSGSSNSSGINSSYYGAGDDCRCRRRHRTCWSLLLGL